jgi:hypothetical protein
MIGGLDDLNGFLTSLRQTGDPREKQRLVLGSLCIATLGCMLAASSAITSVVGPDVVLLQAAGDEKV